MLFPMKSKARLGVETLEDRLCMSVTATLINEGTVLQIVGDDENDHVWVNQDNATGQIYVSSFMQHINDNMITLSNTMQVFDMTNLERVEIDLGGGDDLLTYSISNGERRGPKFINVNLGSGNDSAIFNFAGPQAQNYGGAVGGPETFGKVMPVDGVNLNPADAPIEATVDAILDGDDVQPPMQDLVGPTIAPMMTTLRRNLFLRVLGGQGDDQVTVQVGNLGKKALLDVDIRLGQGDDTGIVTLYGTMAAGSRLRNNLRGDQGDDLLMVETGVAARVEDKALFVSTLLGLNGNDRLISYFRGFLAGTFKSHLGGGQGNDFLDSRAQTTWDSTGRVSLISHGDQGDDEIISLVNQEVPPADILFIVPWAPGTDFAQQVDGGKGRDTLVGMGSTEVKNIESAIYLASGNVFAI